MNTRKNVEPLSDHPLFRALILMGGSLAVGCGGVAERDAPSRLDVGSAGSASGGAASIAAAGSLSASVGGRSIMIDPPAASAGALATSGGAPAATGPNAAAVYNPSCPYEQWDCSAQQAPGACNIVLLSKDDPRAAGCICDNSRPTSAAACKLDESFVCRQGYPPYVEAQPSPSTWDGTLHVQCACVPTPKPGYYDDCAATCTKLFSTATGWPPMRCFLADSTCDEQGVCTATSADVLRQDGIMCGCADIGLK